MNKSQAAVDEALRLHLFGLYTVNGLRFTVYGFKRKGKNGTKEKIRRVKRKVKQIHVKRPAIGYVTEYLFQL